MTANGFARSYCRTCVHYRPSPSNAPDVPHPGGPVPIRRPGCVAAVCAPTHLYAGGADEQRALLSNTPPMCNFWRTMIFLANRGTTLRTGLITAALALIPAAAFAHTGAGEPHGFVSGLAHPLGGLDHILAMVTVGIFAWQLGGRALWLVPGSFVLAMAAGAALGMAGVALPFAELGIVAFARSAPIVIAMGIV